ncbi:hypothetical protein ATANTOWER_014910 [Ataeniobius toweri]|uniref:Uncharacterized protein n=1 Tax=Ataeniobius toweri TaxID=208326 RepID=A0ABU7BRR4_9TELE|nr:hypothetical protein [Ataeniobius toweri]
MSTLRLESLRTSAGCNRYRETGRVTERRRSGRPLDTSQTDDWIIVNRALQNRMMNAPKLQAHLREVKGTQLRPLETVYISLVCVVDDLQGYLTMPPRTGIIVLLVPGSLYAGEGPMVSYVAVVWLDQCTDGDSRVGW